jgi:hypothetical protein
MPFVAGRGAWPSALSRARVFRVYRSEAKTLLDQEKRTVRRRFSGRKGGALLWKGIEPLSVNYVCEKSPDSLGVW